MSTRCSLSTSSTSGRSSDRQADVQAGQRHDVRVSHSLFVYGTLAPGRPNEHVLVEVPGRWSPLR